MADFPIGTVVVLKSGGPKMTVVKHDKSVEDESDTFTHQCIWFELGLALSGGGDSYSGVPQTRFFPPESLFAAE